PHALSDCRTRWASDRGATAHSCQISALRLILDIERVRGAWRADRRGCRESRRARRRCRTTDGRLGGPGARTARLLCEPGRLSEQIRPVCDIPTAARRIDRRQYEVDPAQTTRDGAQGYP